MGTRGVRTAAPTTRLLVAALAALATFVLALVLAGGGPLEAAPGLPDAGRWTGWTLRVVELADLLVAVVVVGSLLVPAVLVPVVDDRERTRRVRPAARSAAWPAAVSGALSLLASALTAADTAGVPFGTLVRDGPVPDLTAGGAGAHLLSALMAVALAAGLSRVGPSVAAARAALVLALAALLPPALVGHAAAASDREVAATGIVVHVVASALWVGGLAAVVVLASRAPERLEVATRRFSHLALGAVGALAMSGVISAHSRLGLSGATWSSGYGALVGAKVALLVALCACGQVHRRRTLPALARGAGRPFRRLVAVEVSLMGVAMGVAAALTRAPLPTRPGAPSHGTTHSSLPDVVAPFSATQVLVAVRPNALAIVVVVGAFLAYRAGVRRVRLLGTIWPASRMRAAGAACAVALLALCSGVATYAPAMLSIQVVQLLLMLLVVPALGARAAPLELWRRTQVRSDRRRDAVVDAVFDSAAGGGVGAGIFLVLLYRTPLIEASLASHWLHLLVLVAASALGFLFLGPLLAPRASRPAHRDLIHWAALAVPVLCLASLGVQLLTGDRLLAAAWFLELRWGWVDPAADQRRAGLAACLGAALVVVLVVATAVAGRRGSRSRTDGRTEREGSPQPIGHSVATTRPSRSSAATGP